MSGHNHTTWLFCSARAVVPTIAIFLLLGHPLSTTLAAEPAFAILTTQAGRSPELHLNDELRLRVTGADASLLKLKIDGVPLAIKPKIDDREIVFPLTRDKDTQAS